VSKLSVLQTPLYGSSSCCARSCRSLARRDADSGQAPHQIGSIFDMHENEAGCLARRHVQNSGRNILPRARTARRADRRSHDHRQFYPLHSRRIPHGHGTLVSSLHGYVSVCEFSPSCRCPCRNADRRHPGAVGFRRRFSLELPFSELNLRLVNIDFACPVFANLA